ncbi:hypothetical protein F5B20DRAFT_575601 [Whalleya microplaca]|nr:hypothetical protein F5B20DRAFT_575601 [Whalleya microplaca]
MADSWRDQLNERLESSIRRRAYESIQVLVLCWEDGHKGYREEGQAAREMFENDFGYPTREFPIPTNNSYGQLLQLITRSLNDIGTAANEKRASSLLIVHYGGHGDADDDKHGGQERRSVWAAHQEGEPVLKWYMIQDQFDYIKTSDTDILLLLDCCFAAQAGRARDSSHGRLEIMAASAMGMKTPAPGNTSFTNILLREIRRTIKDGGSVDMRHLHGQMCHRKVDLWATPIYMTLKGGKGTMQLHPLPKSTTPTTPTSVQVRNKATQGTFIHILVQIEEELDSWGSTNSASG